MDSGWLVQDQAVIAYMKKLELHKYAYICAMHMFCVHLSCLMLLRLVC